MQTETEAKFLRINHQVLRMELLKQGAVCNVPMRLMRRVIMDFPDGRLQKESSFIRVREEGNKSTLTFKQFDAMTSIGGAKEIETMVGSFDEAIKIQQALGLVIKSVQESKRETWVLEDVEIVLDEWPWLEPYIEIEGPTEAEVKRTAMRLGLDWQTAIFGDATEAYRAQYPHMPEDANIAQIPSIKFGDPLPALLQP